MPSPDAAARKAAEAAAVLHVPSPSRSNRPQPSRRHGGAWKVAYADFVTALMALFIVLWLVNSGEKVKASVSGYFRDPRGYSQRLGAGAGSGGEGLPVYRDTVHDLREHVEAALRQMPGLGGIRDNVQFAMTGEGLRIDLMEGEQGTFFVSGQPIPSAAGRALLQVLATELMRLHNSVIIEGHTDARPFRHAMPTSGYGNWELSVDRANAARRLLHECGLPPERVVEIRGYADRKLLTGSNPDDARNRRISLVVRFVAE